MVSEAHLLHELVLRDGDGRVLRHRVAQRRHLLHREPDGRKREHHRRRLEALFQIIDLQQDDETADAMQFELEELAERFNITRTRVVTTETAREDGSVDVNIRLELEQDNKPKLTLIEGNKTDGNIYTLKPTDPLKP